MSVTAHYSAPLEKVLNWLPRVEALCIKWLCIQLSRPYYPKAKSDRWIATHLQVNHRTVKKIREDLEAGLKGPVVQIRTKKLSSYESQITQCIKAGLSAQLIWEQLKYGNQLLVDTS